MTYLNAFVCEPSGSTGESTRCHNHHTWTVYHSCGLRGAREGSESCPTGMCRRRTRSRMADLLNSALIAHGGKTRVSSVMWSRTFRSWKSSRSRASRAGAVPTGNCSSSRKHSRGTRVALISSYLVCPSVNWTPWQLLEYLQRDAS